MIKALAQINITEKLFNAGSIAESPWWVTLCNSVARCDFGPGILISTLLPNLLILAGVIFFLLILGGGFMMVSGAGKEPSAQDKAKAQGAITYGVIGFLLVISAYFILQIVGVITGINFITPPTL